MIPALEPYPGYKDSSVRWLGAVPEHWEVRRLRNVAELRVSTIDKHVREDELPVRLCNYVDVYKNDRIRPGMSFMSATARAEDISRFRLEDGDVLITKDSEVWTDIGVPALVEGRADDLVSGYHLALLRPRARACVGAFLLRALQSLPVAYQLHVEATGVTRYGLSHDAIKSVWLPAPPLPEQHALVRYLDYMDRRIRRYIRAKQKLLKLLEEQKQAIVEQGVLRGVEPDALRRDSEIGWMGIVPAHWQVRRAKTLFKEVDRRTTTGQETLLSLRMYAGLVPHETVSTVPIEPTALIGFKKVRPDQLVMNRMRAAIGLFGIAHEDGLVSPDYAVFDLAPDMDPEYALCVLKTRAAGSEFRRESKGLGTGSSGFMRLYTDRFGAVKLPLPSAEEQHRILDWISGETREISAAESRVEREIGLLREYRARLIADLVTGKLDVRDAAAELPDEPEEDEPSDEADLLEEEDLLEPDDADADRGEL